MHLHEMIVINRPVEDVWAFLLQPHSESAWHSAIVDEWMTSEGELHAGSTGVQVFKFLGRRVESAWVVTEFVPGHKIAMRSAGGPTTWEGSYLLEPDGASTRFTVDAREQPGGAGRLLAPLFDRLSRKQWLNDLARLQHVIESRPTDQSLPHRDDLRH